MKKGTRIGNVFTDEMKEVIRNKDLTSQQVGDILRSVLYPSEFEITDGTAKYIAKSLTRGYVEVTLSSAESRLNELDRLNRHYETKKSKCPDWFPAYYKLNSEYLNNVILTLLKIVERSTNVSDDITNVSATLDNPPITLNKLKLKDKLKDKLKLNDTDTDTDTEVPPKSPGGLRGENSTSSEPTSLLDDPAAALGLPSGEGGKDSAKDGRAQNGDEVAKIAAEIESGYRYKVNRGKLRKCLKSVLKKNSAAEVLGGYRRWLAVWQADDFQWAPSRITDWLYDAKFLEQPRRGNTRAAPQVDPDTVSSDSHLDLV